MRRRPNPTQERGPSQQDRGPRINERIRVREVRLIDANGEQLGVVATEEALQRAKDQSLDLVEVAEKSRPPVCKIMDFGKYKYELKLKKRQNAKKQHKVVLKEVRIRPKTGEHDYQVKAKAARRFLEKGAKVQVNVLFRGRERTHTDIARAHLDRMCQELEEVGKVEVAPKMEGFRMLMVLAPTGRVIPKPAAPAEAGKGKGKGKARPDGKPGEPVAAGAEDEELVSSGSDVDLDEDDDLDEGDEGDDAEGDDAEGEDDAEASEEEALAER